MWDSTLQTFVAVLDLFKTPDGSVETPYPPPSVRHGTRFGEFVTFDSLINHLIALGLPPDSDTLANLYRLGELVAEVEGQPEFVGFTIADTHRLFLRTPSGSMLEMYPRLGHPDHGLRWGDVHPTTVETARLLCQLAFVRQPGQDLETFALALTHEYLRLVGRDFSLSATATCDWFLTDSPPSTTLSATDVARLRAELECKTPREPLVDTRRERESFAG